MRSTASPRASTRPPRRSRRATPPCRSSGSRRGRRTWLAAPVSSCAKTRRPSPIACTCLRRVADDYRKGVSPATARALGDDTNYVAAMEQAANHVPPDCSPAVIFFTDGKHEAAGCRCRRHPRARPSVRGALAVRLLPVGMGVDADDRPRLEPGSRSSDHARLREMRWRAARWPDVVFDTADAPARPSRWRSRTCPARSRSSRPRRHPRPRRRRRHHRSRTSG